LGWLGELALAPKDGADPALRAHVLASARHTLAALIAAVVVFGILGIGGFLGLLAFLAFAISGRIRSKLCPSTNHGGIYAEAFALYMLLFFSMSFGASVLVEKQKLESAKMLLTGTVMLLSLSALLWPVLRGIPWRTVREDIGWIRGRRKGLELAAGIGGYAMSVPLLAVGVVLVLLLMLAMSQLAFQTGPGTGDGFRPSNLPAHPIIQLLADSSWWQRVQVWVLASIVAPIVEETMFRGVLYRHLRDGSQWIGTLPSILISGTIVSFIFAVIHPQGIIAVPALMALAYGFTILREWRGSVIPCMVAHGMNNGIVTIIAMAALS
jgi:membrane protease YdiL (CAAX protease family)